jgi:hypothetical protein
MNRQSNVAETNEQMMDDSTSGQDLVANQRR